MNIYIICSDTNYDLMVHIVNANNEEEAIEMASNKGAWLGCRATKLNTTKKGVVFQE